MTSRMAFPTLMLLFIFTSSLLQARILNVPDDFETIQSGDQRSGGWGYSVGESGNLR
jgi:hypothetical protein